MAGSMAKNRACHAGTSGLDSVRLLSVIIGQSPFKEETAPARGSRVGKTQTPRSVRGDNAKSQTQLRPTCPEPRRASPRTGKGSLWPTSRPFNGFYAETD